MFRLESPQYFFLILIIAVLLLAWNVAAQRADRLWSRLGNAEVLRRSLYSPARSMLWMRYGLIACLSLLTIAMVNPQFGHKKEKVRAQNAEVFIALDVSQSMMATDIKPSRLSRAKIWIKQFTDRFPSEKIGLITFAGNAYLQSPLTNDAATINLLSAIADPSIASTQGTSLSAAIDMAIQSFASRDGYHKLLIIITDGEDHEGGVMEKAEEAAKKGITIAMLPVGTTEGSMIPVQQGGNTDYKRDQQGQQVITRPNLELMQKIVDRNGGLMLSLDQGMDVFNKLQEKIKTLLRKEVSYQSFNEFDSFFQWPLFLSALALVSAIMFFEKSKLQS